ncbi:MAG TPA: hypothetical protein VD735_01690 [Candidatus Saccharimonadales bacterium]|nr:hypothetical protein [Candidatus Saccharimonadales bacterium]
MKFYCIITSYDKPYNKQSFAYLQEAATARGLEFVVLESDRFDYAQDMQQALETPCILYRLSVSQQAGMLEVQLLRPGVTTLYRDSYAAMVRAYPWGNALRLQAAGLPIIPTVFNLVKDQEDRLPAYVAQLGGFPVILKAAGGSHGASVLRLDSEESLRSVLGFVTANTDAHFVLRKYIHDATHLRMVVVGDTVADAIRYLPQPGDFRTNAVSVPEVEAFPATADNAHLFELAVQATQALGLDFGGVDLLLEADGAATIAEVNFPCNFSRNQMNTGVDVAGMIVDHLIAKSAASAA